MEPNYAEIATVDAIRRQVAELLGWKIEARSTDLPNNQTFAVFDPNGKPQQMFGYFTRGNIWRQDQIDRLLPDYPCDVKLAISLPIDGIWHIMPPIETMPSFSTWGVVIIEGRDVAGSAQHSDLAMACCLAWLDYKNSEANNG